VDRITNSIAGVSLEISDGPGVLNSGSVGHSGLWWIN